MNRTPARTEIVHVISAMRRNPAAPFHTEAVASGLGASTSSFIHAFKHATGISPLRFRAALRIELAKQLLLATAQSVTDVCFEVGYNSLGTFTRTFSTMVGLAPSRLRELARSRPDGDLSGLPEARSFVGPDELNATAIDVCVSELGAAQPLIVAGLFHEAVPAGWPIHGRLSLGERRIQLLWPTELSRACLLVAAISAPLARGLWMPDLHDVSVYAHCFRRRGVGCRPQIEIEARLRRLRETDPPVVVALPLLITAQAASRRAPTATHDQQRNPTWSAIPVD
jgi:AraC-like DNA-binding protein